MKEGKRRKRCARVHVVTVRDYDGRLLRREFIDETDALEFKILITRRVQRYKAGLELIPEQITFREWADIWIERRKKSHPKATWAKDESRLRRTWTPELGDLKLQAIHASRLREVFDRLSKEGLSNATINRHRALLHRMWVEARREEPALATTNPVSSIPKLPENWREQHQPTWDDEEALDRYCMAAWEFSGGWGALATLLAWTGMRRGEVCALRWEDIDWKKNEIHVRRTVEAVSNEHKLRVKSRSPYVVMLLPVVREALERLKKYRGGRVKPSDTVAGPVSYWDAGKLHKKTTRWAGLPYISIHRVRHSFARMLKREGFSREEIRDLLGHKSVQTTQRYTETGIEHIWAKAKKTGFGR